MLEGTGVDKGLPQEVINKIINSQEVINKIINSVTLKLVLQLVFSIATISNSYVNSRV